MKPKNILITGCRRGIGRDTAIALAKMGHRVMATVHRQESVADLQQNARQQGVDLEIFKFDILDENDRKKISTLELDVLINNAAIGQSGSLTEVPFSRVRQNFETNLFATLEISQLALKQMIKNNSGQIIFISSIAGRMPMIFWGPYCMTKFALSAAADIMRQELKMIKSKVNISVVEPGTYHTGFNQDVMATKYTWMDESSYFYSIINQIKNQEEKIFSWLERKNNKSIVKKIVQAVNSNQPRLRYSAPWWQALFVRILRIFGK